MFTLLSFIETENILDVHKGTSEKSLKIKLRLKEII